MIEYIEYHNSKTSIIKTFESITWNYHLKYVISVLLQPQCNDISSYLRNYKKKYGNQYQIPIFINAKTILVVIYGYRALSNYAVNIFSIKSLLIKIGVVKYTLKIHKLKFKKMSIYQIINAKRIAIT